MFFLITRSARSEATVRRLGRLGGQIRWSIETMWVKGVHSFSVFGTCRVIIIAKLGILRSTMAVGPSAKSERSYKKLRATSDLVGNLTPLHE